MSRRLQLWIPVALLVAAFGLRLYRLDYPDITGDEAWSVTIASRSLGQVVASDAETNPPLYHLMLWGMMRLAGRSPLAIRYTSVLCGTLALALIYQLGRRVADGRLAIVSLAAGSVSPFLLYYAQDARMYGPALLGAAGSMALFAWLQRDQLNSQNTPRRRWLAYAVFSLAAVFSHYYAFAILLAQALFMSGMALRRRSWHVIRPWLLTWTGMAAVFVPWFLFHLTFLQIKTSSRFEEWTAGKLLELARRTLLAYGGGVTPPIKAMWLAWILVGLAGLGALVLSRRQQRGALGVWLGLAVACGPLFAWAINPIMPFFWERYLLVGMPAFVVLLAGGLMALARRARLAAWVGVGVVLVVSQQALARHFFDPAVLRGSYGRLMTDVAQRAQPGDLLLLNNPLQGSLYDIYAPPELPASFIDRGQLLRDSDAEAHLAALTAGYQRVWLVEMGNEAEYDPGQRAQRWLAEHGSRAYYENYVNGGVLYLFILGSDASVWQPAAATFGDRVRLIGFRLGPASAPAGETLRVSLRWEVLAAFDRNYTVFNHLVSQDGQVAAQTDGEPVGGARPTSSWKPGDIIEDNYAILLPATLPAGSYTVRVGMYLWPELTRLPVTSSDRPTVADGVALGAVDVR